MPPAEAGMAPAKACSQCGATKTPQWREGPLGPKTLCNACGVKRVRAARAAAEGRRRGGGAASASGLAGSKPPPTKKPKKERVAKPEKERGVNPGKPEKPEVGAEAGGGNGGGGDGGREAAKQRHDRRMANAAALSGKNPMGARSAAMILAAVQEKEGDRKGGVNGLPCGPERTSPRPPAEGSAGGGRRAEDGPGSPERPAAAAGTPGVAVTPPAAPGVAGGALVSPLRPAAGTPAGAPPPSPGVTGAVGEGAAAAVGLMSMSLPKDAVKGAHEAQAAGVVGHPGLPHRPLARVPPPRFEPAPQDLPLGFPAKAQASVLSPGSGLPSLMPPPPVRGSTAGGAAPVAEPGRELAVPAPAQAASASSAGTAPAGNGALEGELRELQATAADAQRSATIADAAVAAVAQVLAIKQAVAVHARAEATAARERLALALQKSTGGGPATAAEEKGRGEGG